MTTARDILGLGSRGLSPVEQTSRSRMDVRSIRVDMIQPDPDQPRKTFDDSKIDELAASIRQDGLLQPIRVRPDATAPGRFFLIAGERRWRAAQRVPLVEIDAVVVSQRQADDRTRVEQAVENLQREEMNAVEEGACYRAFLDAWGCSQAELSRRLAKSPTRISRMLSVLELDDETKRKIVAGEINYMDALALRDKQAAAAEAKPKPSKPGRKPAAVPRGTIPTPFGTVKLKRGAKLEELVAALVDMVEKRRGAA
jgi:ParB family chromosome partitioning protein